MDTRSTPEIESCDDMVVLGNGYGILLVRSSEVHAYLQGYLHMAGLGAVLTLSALLVGIA